MSIPPPLGLLSASAAVSKGYRCLFLFYCCCLFGLFFGHKNRREISRLYLSNNFHCSILQVVVCRSRATIFQLLEY